MKSYDRNFYDLLTQTGQTYIIPSFQRNYSWDIRQWDDLWDDISFLVKNKEKFHYTGSLVYIPSEEHSIFLREVIDGQQRLTTVSLMYLAMYQLLKEGKLSNFDPENLRIQVLENPISSPDRSRLKLKPAGEDGVVYTKIFEGETADLQSDEKQSNIYRCYRFFLEKLEDAQFEIEELIGAAQRLQVIEIVLNHNDDHPQKVFESINSTGKKLTVDDLIRNYVLMRGNYDDRERFYNNYWIKIESRLRLGNETLLEEFFTVFIKNREQKDVTKSTLYESFKKIYDQEPNPEIFLEQILQFAGIYEYYKFDKGVYSEKLSFIRYQLDVLNYMRVDVFNTFILSVLDDYLDQKLDKNDVAEVFDFIVNYLSRRILAGKTTTSLNKYVPGLYAKLLKYQIDSLSDVLINEFTINVPLPIIYPSDQEVEQGIRTQDFYSRRKDYCRYILLAIDNANRDNQHKKLLQDGSLTIEHVMPQTLTTKWREDLGSNYQDTYELYINNLANLTLTAYNSTYSNKPYSEKRFTPEQNGLAESPLLINQLFKENDTWNAGTLTQRQDILVSELLRIFPALQAQNNYIDKIDDEFIQIDQLSDPTGKTPEGYILFETIYPIDSWAWMFIGFFNNILEQYPSDTVVKIAEQLSSGKLLISKDESGMHAPARLSNGYFLESGKSSKDIVSTMLKFVDLANNLDPKDLKIKIRDN